MAHPPSHHAFVGRSFASVATTLVLLALAVLGPASRADLAAPAWWDQNAVGAAPDWHYRVPVNVPAGTAIHSTVRVDIDFNALLAQLGVAGAFDAQSPRVVRSSGTLATFQEFTDRIYVGATDAAGNGRGEVRFILEDAGPVTYYIYFDITANGAKPANPATPINGGFELGAIGAEDPPGWNAVKTSAAYDAQIRPSENPRVRADGGTPGQVTTDGRPFSGAQSYLLGARTANEPSSGTNQVTLTKSFTMPSSCPSGISLRYRPEGWDSSWGGATQYDFIRIRLVYGGTARVLVGPDAPGANGNYAQFPYSPNFSSSAGSASGVLTSGYGRYNGFDNATLFHTLGMSIPRGEEPWFNPTNSLAGIPAGANVTLEITSSHSTEYRSWYHIDHVEWCVVGATTGAPEGFGVEILTPSATLTHSGGTLVIQARVDAAPSTAANAVTADLFDGSGGQVASGIRLFNDGEHGDAVAGDAIWTNDGSDPSEPTYTLPPGTSGSNWTVRVRARDDSTSTVGATHGLVHRPGQPNAPESGDNYFNVDDQTFTVAGPALVQVKTVQVASDPLNGATNPKSIPGSMQLYTLRVTNEGGGAVDPDSLVVTDAAPANTALCELNGASSGPVGFVDGSSGLTYTFLGLDRPDDDLDFSNDGGATWSYTPTPDVDGCNAAITHIRVNPKGAMAGSSGSSHPWFELTFRVRVQ